MIEFETGDFIGTSTIGNKKQSSLSLTLFNPGFLGVLGVTVFVDALMVMVSLIPGPITMRFGMFLTPFSLRRLFGKLRFLKG